MFVVDDEALRSCLITLAEAEGRFVTTIEGLSRDRSHPVQQALVAQQAIQCGFCTPGIAIAAAALLARNAEPDDEEIVAAIPDLCRGGTYPRLLEAPAPGYCRAGRRPVQCPRSRRFRLARRETNSMGQDEQEHFR